MLAPPLHKCAIVRMPPPSSEILLLPEMSWRSEHVVPINDWVELACPLRLIEEWNKGRTLEVKRFVRAPPTTPTFGILHFGSSDWWINRIDHPNLANWTSTFEETRREAIAVAQRDCENRLCWWSLPVRKVQLGRIHIDGTLLPGHSGSCCRRTAVSTGCYGIVQGFHFKSDSSVCSTLSSEAPCRLWPLMAIAPIWVLVWVSVRVRRAKRFEAAVVVAVCAILVRLNERCLTL